MAKVECIGGGESYVGHGADCVLLCFTQEVGWWRNSVGLSPSAARDLAARLVDQAEAAEALMAEAARNGGPSGEGE